MPDIKQPPRWAQTLLRQLADPRTLEEIEGDLTELYHIWYHNHGVTRANILYIKTVISLLRPFTKKQPNPFPNNTLNPLTMLLSYFKMSWRTLRKNKVSSLINISGLTIGLCTSIIITLVVMDEFRYDRFHTNLNDIYILLKNQSTNDGISTGESTPGPVAAALRTDFPEVKYAARISYFGGQRITVDKTSHFESGVYVDADLFKILTFTPLYGDPIRSLQHESEIVITRDIAMKWFKTENAVGKNITFNKTRALTVGAVIENVPRHSSVRFEIAMPFYQLEKDNEWLTKWDDNRIHTWLQLEPNADISKLNTRATELLQQRTNDKTESFFVYPLERYYLHGSFSNGKADGGRITAVMILIGFGVFMISIACINFMNIATAQSEFRAREVGVRKVLGASRKWIVMQFLNESFIITFLSLTLAIGLVVMIVPSFNTLTHSSIAFDFRSGPIWMSIMAIGIVTTLLAGIYPAFFLSRFLPAKVLKGKTGSLKGVGLRRVLVSFQFIISTFFLIATVIMYAQFDYVRNRPLGYEQSNLVNINLDSLLTTKFNYLYDEVHKIPGVLSVTGSSNNILDIDGSVTGMDWPGKNAGDELSVAVADVTYDWAETMDIKMKDGRDFDRDFPADAKSSCLINESAASKMGLDDAVGSVVGGKTVVGVFQDYVYNNPFKSVEPMTIYLNPGHVNHLYIRVENNANWRVAIDRIEKLFKSLNPDHPFTFSFTKDEYQNRFNELSDGGLMVSIFGGMTIFISCLGLFGLAGFVAEKRSKEMSIRKVFGASGLRILASLSGDFLKPVIIALLIVIPFSVFLASEVLSKFSYRAPLDWMLFALCGLVVLFLGFTIVLYHGWRTANENPVKRLKNE